jgi:hypothetical protein
MICKKVFERKKEEERPSSTEKPCECHVNTRKREDNI